MSAEKCRKDRLAHDQSYKWGSEISVNSRVDEELLLPCKFGACLKRLMNWAVVARKRYPNRRIVASKIDYISLQTVSFECGGSSSNLHSIARRKLDHHGPPAYFWWFPLPLRMGVHFRINL